MKPNLKIIPQDEPTKHVGWAIDDKPNEYRYKMPYFADASKHPIEITPVKARLNELKKGKRVVVSEKKWWEVWK
ncbi:MAG TPA: hypothetical protein VK559_07150 [Ferruginibacter sp.]|nr:hypothetical protein [Ferruginibacter sp.]